MTFQSPDWLWALLLLPVLAVGLVAWARGRRRAAAAGGPSPGSWR